MASDLSVDQYRATWPRCIGTSPLRRLNASQLRAMVGPTFVLGRVGEKPLGVLVPYALFMEWQNTIALLAGVVPHAPQEKEKDDDDVSRVDGECLSGRQELPRKPPTGCL